MTDSPHFERLRLTGPWQTCPVALTGADLSPLGAWISVPECCHLQPALYPDNPYWGEHIRVLNQTGWLYRRTFHLDHHRPRRARLLFEAVDYYAEVWVNDQFVGRHEGHFAPFTFDITAQVGSGDNTLEVRVSAPWDPPNPRGTYPTDHVIRGLVKGLYEHGEGVIPPDVNPIGIWRPVWLLLDHGINLDQVHVETTLDGQVRVSAAVTNATERAWAGRLDLRIEAENHDGPGTSAALTVRLEPGSSRVEHSLQLEDPRWWWCWDHGRPDLYRLRAALTEDGSSALSEHEIVFGVRTVRLERSPERFTYYLNERPVFVRGTSYMPGLYLSQCDEAHLARDVTLAREAHLNLLRVHVHVSPPELYDLCDRAGMLIWQDFELNWIQDPSEQFEARARVLQREMIDLLRSHPSVITWACHNEPTMIFTRRHNLEQRPDPALYADACAQDPTRPVFLCSGQMEGDWQRAGDVHSYYGALWSARYTDMYEHRFRLNTEFGFEAPASASTLRLSPVVWARLQHVEDQLPALWQYQAELTQYQVEHLRRQRAICSGGYIHFWLVDLVPQVGCGALDSERQPKGGYPALQRASQPLLASLEHDGRQPYALWVCNDMPEAHPDAVIRLQILDAQDLLLHEQTWTRTLPANTTFRLARADWDIAPAQCARITIEIVSAEGEILATNAYAHPFRPSPRPRGYPWKFDQVLGTKVFDRADAPSLADHNINRVFKLVPLAARETIAEWALRQRLPHGVVSRLARLIDWMTT